MGAGGVHAGESGIAFRVWLGEVVDVGAGAVAGDLGDDGGAAVACRLEWFDGEDCRAFAEGEAVAVFVERAGDGRGERLEGIETGEDEQAEGIVAAGDGAIGAAGCHEIRRVADGVRAGCAGVGDDGCGTADPEGVAEGVGLVLWLVAVDAGRLATVLVVAGGELAVVGFAEFHGAGRGAEHQRGGRAGSGFPAGVADGLGAGVDEHGGSAIEPLLLACGQVVPGEGFGEVDLACPAGALPGGVEQGDFADGAAAGSKACGVVLPAETDGADDTGTGDDDAAAWGAGLLRLEGHGGAFYWIGSVDSEPGVRWGTASQDERPCCGRGTGGVMVSLGMGLV